MNKAPLLAMVLLATVMCLAGPGWTQEKAAAPDVDGHVWMNSNPQEKKAFLLGAGSAFVLEYYIRTKHGEQPSRYVQGWVEVLKDQKWSDLEKSLDQYYTDNPDKRNEHVFHVIWHQMIEPNLKD